MLEKESGLFFFHYPPYLSNYPYYQRMRQEKRIRYIEMLAKGSDLFFFRLQELYSFSASESVGKRKYLFFFFVKNDLIFSE